MNPVLSLALFTILYAFITEHPKAFSNDNIKPQCFLEKNNSNLVLDILGKPVSASGAYYLQQAIFGPTGGGVALGRAKGSPCRDILLQVLSEVERGIPAKFAIPNTSDGVIANTTEFDVSFIYKPLCVNSSKWIVFVDNDIKKSCIGVGGPNNFPGKKILSGKFKIYSVGCKSYKIGFCVEGSDCKLIGRYDNGEYGRRLCLVDGHGVYDFTIGFQPGPLVELV